VAAESCDPLSAEELVDLAAGQRIDSERELEAGAAGKGEDQ